MTDPAAIRHDRSPFHWNAGAWFGSQIGGTIWMLAGAIFLRPVVPSVGLTWLIAFVVCTAASLYFWSQREHLRAYAAFQRSLLLVAIAALACIVTAHFSGQLPRLAFGNQSMPWAAYIAWLVFPSLMIRFYLRERAAQHAQD